MHKVPQTSPGEPNPGDECLHDDPLALRAEVETQDMNPVALSTLRYFCGICDTPLGKHEPMIRDHLQRVPAMATDMIPMGRLEDLAREDQVFYKVPDVLTPIIYDEAPEVTPFSQVSTGRLWNREQGRFWPTHMSAFNRKDR